MLNVNSFSEVIKNLPTDKKELADSILIELAEIDKRLDEIRTKPFIVTNPSYENIKRKSLEYDIYKDLLTQKNLYVKTLFTLINRVDTEDENPFADFNEKFEEHRNNK